MNANFTKLIRIHVLATLLMVLRILMQADISDLRYVITVRRAVSLFVLWTTVTSSPLEYLEEIMTYSPKQDAVIPGTARTPGPLQQG